MASIKSSIQLFDNASPALRSMSNALNICINSFESLARTSGKGLDTASLKLAKDELAKCEVNVKDIENNIELAKKQQDKFNGSIKNGQSGLGGLGKGFLKLAGTIATALGVNKILETSDEMVSIGARLDMIKSKGETVEEIQNKIFESAQRSRGSYTDTADAIGKMGIMAKDSFSSTDELVAFMEQINKQFVIAGTAPEGVKAGMLQLTQAMASGVLRGEELNSIFEQAPTIIHSIAEYMGEPVGRIRELAKEGKITADIVKNAMFFTAEETNAKFENMPKTFGQIKTAMANEAQMAFQPVLQQINDLMNNEKFMSFTTRILSGISSIASLTTTAFNGLIGMADVVANNWDLIAPIIGGVTTALLLYKGVQIATTVSTWAMSTAEDIKSAKLALSTGATWGATVAQNGLNASILACPITWIVLGIIALVTAVIVLIKWLGKLTGAWDSVLGFLAGTVTWLLSVIWNAFIGTINAIIQFFYTRFIEPFISIWEWILNALNGGFNGFGGAVANLIGQIISWFLSLGKVVTKIVDAIFGTSWTDGLNDLQNEVVKWGKKEDAITIERNAPTIESLTNDKVGRWASKDAFKTGAKWGDDLTKKVSGIFKKEDEDELEKLKKDATQNDPSKYLTDISNFTGNTANNTDKIADSMDWLDEDIKYLNDIAEREAINRYTTAEIKVDLTNNNSISSQVDADNFFDRFNENLIEVLQTCAEGVH